MTVPMVVICGPNGPYGPDGWLGLFELLGLGWYNYKMYMYMYTCTCTLRTVLPIGAIGPVGIGMSGLAGLSAQHVYKSHAQKVVFYFLMKQMC